MRFSAEVEWMTTPWLPGVVSITEGQIDGEMETGAKTYHDWHLGKVKDWKSKQWSYYIPFNYLQDSIFPLNKITFGQCREYHFKFSIRFIYVHVLLVERELRRWLVHIWTRVRLGQKVMQNLVAVISSDWLCPAESEWRALSRLLWSFEPIGVHLN